MINGYWGAWKFLGSDTARTIAEDCLKGVDYAWVTDYTHPDTGQHVDQGIRYVVPLRVNGEHVPADHFDNNPGQGARFASSPLGSVNIFLVSGMEWLAIDGSTQAVRDRARQISDLLFPGDNNDIRWDKWFSVMPSRYRRSH